MKVGFVFSGQGAQAAGMGKELFDNFPCCRDVFLKADRELGYFLSTLCFEGGDDLNDTRYAQPAIFTMSGAALALLKEKGVEPVCAAGLSLGEYGALYAAGLFSFEDGIRLVAKRGEMMSSALPPGFGTMSAVLGMEDEACQEACLQASQEDDYVIPANYNCPGQIVISGKTSAVERGEDICRQLGAKRVMRLKVSGPFHTGYLRPAADAFQEEAGQVSLGVQAFPVISNASGKAENYRDNFTDLLANQIVSPVRWTDSVQTMIAMGVEVFVEIGPGKTLCSFIKKINKDAETYHIEDLASFEKFMSRLA